MSVVKFINNDSCFGGGGLLFMSYETGGVGMWLKLGSLVVITCYGCVLLSLYLMTQWEGYNVEKGWVVTSIKLMFVFFISPFIIFMTRLEMGLVVSYSAYVFYVLLMFFFSVVGLKYLYYGSVKKARFETAEYCGRWGVLLQAKMWFWAHGLISMLMVSYFFFEIMANVFCVVMFIPFADSIVVVTLVTLISTVCGTVLLGVISFCQDLTTFWVHLISFSWGFLMAFYYVMLLGLLL